MSALDKQEGGTHYKDMPIQPIEFITKNKLDWYQGNIVKYASRHHNKGGADDLRKVIHYAELALEAQYGQPVADALETQYGGLSGSACGVVGTKHIWYPEKPEGYGPWIERKDDDLLMMGPFAQVFCLSAFDRISNVGGFEGRFCAFNWNSHSEDANFICAYCVKEKQ